MSFHTVILSCLTAQQSRLAVTNLGKFQGFLCCDVAPDGLTVAAGTELKGEDAFVLYWYSWPQNRSRSVELILLILGILDSLVLLCAFMDQPTLMISRHYRMHLQEAKQNKTLFYLDLPMDL